MIRRKSASSAFRSTGRMKLETFDPPLTSLASTSMVGGRQVHPVHGLPPRCCLIPCGPLPQSTCPSGVVSGETQLREEGARRIQLEVELRPRTQPVGTTGHRRGRGREEPEVGEARRAEAGSGASWGVRVIPRVASERPPLVRPQNAI